MHVYLQTEAMRAARCVLSSAAGSAGQSGKSNLPVSGGLFAPPPLYLFAQHLPELVRGYVI